MLEAHAPPGKRARTFVFLIRRNKTKIEKDSNSPNVQRTLHSAAWRGGEWRWSRQNSRSTRFPVSARMHSNSWWRTPVPHWAPCNLVRNLSVNLWLFFNWKRKKPVGNIQSSLMAAIRSKDGTGKEAVGEVSSGNCGQTGCWSFESRGGGNVNLSYSAREEMEWVNEKRPAVQ